MDACILKNIDFTCSLDCFFFFAVLIVNRIKIYLVMAILIDLSVCRLKLLCSFSVS
jgi:hypothetical protein